MINGTVCKPVIRWFEFNQGLNFSYNEKILKVLTKYLEENPEIRFGQALINLNILQYEKDKYVVFDPFSDESVDIYQRMSKK